MATANDIPSDLALEIGADLAPKRFLAAAREFFSLVDSVTESDQRRKWRVKVREGSNILALAPTDDFLPHDLTKTFDKVEDTVRALVAQDFDDIDLSDDTLDHARKLSEIANDSSHPVPVRVWVRKKPIIYGRDVGQFIREEMATAYWDFGSVEGALSAIQDSSGGLQLQIRDSLWTRRIKCYLPENLLEEAMRLFRKRVEMTGEIHYRKDNSPQAIRVRTLTKLPDDSDLPDIDDIRGLFGNEPKMMCC